MRSFVALSCLCFMSLAMLQSCNFRGCTNEYADNYNEKSNIDDGSCTFHSIEGIVGVTWYRITNNTLYSFTLNPNGNWITRKNCNDRVEGTWEIDTEKSTLKHYYNGIEEEYFIIDPSPTSVKFRGGNNANDDIAPDNSLLVYESSYSLKGRKYFIEGVQYEYKIQTIDFLDSPFSSRGLDTSIIDVYLMQNFRDTVSSICGSNKGDIYLELKHNWVWTLNGPNPIQFSNWNDDRNFIFEPNENGLFFQLNESYVAYYDSYDEQYDPIWESCLVSCTVEAIPTIP